MGISRQEAEAIAFILESNAIENIHREPSVQEIEEHLRFLHLDIVTIPDIEVFVQIYAHQKLRDKTGMDVKVGGRLCPLGGPSIRSALQEILDNIPHKSPWETHVAYELLHPFIDGNGRSGRMLWLWVMEQRGLPLYSGFLRTFYYQTLASMSDGKCRA